MAARRSARTRGWRIAIDVGGTFTDAVAIGDGGQTIVVKVPSTPADPASALVDAVRELSEQGVPLDRVAAVFHGTTVATNAAITGNQARVVLIATEGYRDILSYRAGGRPELYDLMQPRPAELVPRRDRLEVRERLAWNGDVVVPLEEAEIARVVEQVAAREPEAVAIALLFSYVNDRHERALERALRSRLPSTPVTASSAVAREFREYPRTATTALNAGLRPVVGRYLLRARERLRELGAEAPFLVMQSNGGSVPADRADREAHRLLLSGPTAGVAATIALGDRVGADRLIALDMGGTSLDVCLIEGGVPPVTPSQTVDVHPILAPSVDVVTVGAGGGSIASVDAAGRLRVGPQSAGADPGPASYGRGGKEPTLTDAHVVVGALGSDTRLAGRMTLDVEAGRAAVGRVADALGMGVEQAGEGIVAVAMAHVVRALRRVSVERGLDPAGYTLVAFGGAGPLHAGRLLRELRLGGVVVPRHPGLFSASGLVAADLRIDDSQTVLRTFDPAQVSDLVAWYRDASSRARRQLREDGIPASAIRVIGTVDCRYLGQGFELPVAVGGMSARDVARIADDFHDLHERTYGHANRGEPVELVTLRLSAFGAVASPSASDVPRGGPRPPADATVGTRSVLLPGSRRARRVAVLRREALRARNRIEGPAIVEEMDSTTMVLPGQ
ncbi:MAG: hydantoinase/oxoprolinase family protein, partial [Actinomycetota bacterium]